MPKKIQLFWWSEPKLMSKPKENYGDLLGKYLVEKISTKSVVWVHPKKHKLKALFQPIYVTIGSILAHVSIKCIVWGSGIISRETPVAKAKFLAVRGPMTRQYLLNLGYQVPEVYGDPALLLPRFYNPNITKKYTYGIVPHYTDFNLMQQQFSANKEVLLIDLMTNDIEATTNLFLQCEHIISSSLHGLIVAHAYKIPAIWLKFSNNLFGDDVKFEDYLASVQLPFVPQVAMKTKLEFEKYEAFLQSDSAVPKEEIITKLQEGLMQVCPFVNPE